MGKQFYSFCHGWELSERKGFAEVTCRRRESCAYYSVTFYREHGDHLDDFEELFPLEPCPYFTERSVAKRVEPADEKADFFDFMRDNEHE